MSGKTCLRCNTYIPDGRTYCGPHYQEALSLFEGQCIEYERELAYWNSLSAKEQVQHHEVAEEESLVGTAILTGLAIGGGLWFLKSGELERWMGAVLLVACVVVSYLARGLVGRLVRGLFMGILYGIGLLILGCFGYLGLMLLEVLPDVMANIESDYMKYGTIGIALGIVWGWIAEAGGKHHSSAAPSPPIRPSP